MAINVNTANTQAGQLSVYANQLVNAKNQLSSYKSSISTYWQGQEVSYIVRGIDQTIAQIDSVIKQLNSLSSDIKSTAATIKREDDAAAAAARARALKQKRIQTAQVNYNRAVDECDNLYKERERLSLPMLRDKEAIVQINQLMLRDVLLNRKKNGKKIRRWRSQFMLLWKLLDSKICNDI